MTKKEAIKLFEEKKVRTAWDDEQEKWSCFPRFLRNPTKKLMSY